MSDQHQPHESKQEDAASITDGIRDMISTTLDIGASVARMVAEATAGGRPVPPPPQKNPINGIVHYGVVSVVNLVTTVAGSVNDVRSNTSAPSPPPTAPAPSSQPNMPTVHQNAILRIPLSIENPGAVPMTDMEFVCLQMQLQQIEVGGSCSVDWVRFEPEKLTIMPNDFEKITVFIQVPADAAIGIYRASIGLRDNSEVARINFSVISQAA